MNYYEILEVSPKASTEVVRAAYKSLMQRFHPDKNSTDVAMAERASRVVQAYEILSDPVKRAEYDLELRVAVVDLAEPLPVDGRILSRARASTMGEVPERDVRFVWYFCLILGVILFSGWSIKAMLNTELSSESELVPTRPSLKREIPVLLRDVTVSLQDPDNPSAESGLVLFIPAVGVRVGTLDAENALRHLNNTKERLGRRVSQALASATYPELIKADGERYLAQKILDAINENPVDEVVSTSADARTSESGTSNRYGVVEVLLPASYSVK